MRQSASAAPRGDAALALTSSSGSGYDVTRAARRFRWTSRDYWQTNESPTPCERHAPSSGAKTAATAPAGRARRLPAPCAEAPAGRYASSDNRSSAAEVLVQPRPFAARLKSMRQRRSVHVSAHERRLRAGSPPLENLPGRRRATLTRRRPLRSGSAQVVGPARRPPRHPALARP